jgi:capsular exopolysaccharide synthesis family protein
MTMDRSASTASDMIDLGQALAVLRRRLPLIGLCVVVLAGAAFAFSKQQAKEYTATAALQFGSSNLFAQRVLDLSSSSGSDGQTSQQASNVEIVRLGDLAAKTAQRVGGGLTEAEVRDGLEVAAAGESNIVGVSATADSPALAARIANAYVRQFVQEQSGDNRRSFKAALALVNKQLAGLPESQRFGPIAVELQNRAQTLRLLDGIHYGNVRIAAAALPPSVPSSPNTKKDTMVGVLLGLLIGIGLAFALERLERDRLLRDAGDLEAIHRLPLLGVVPENAALSGPSSRQGQAGAAVVDAFQMIRARLRFFSADGARRTILVAAAEPGDGATTVARGLAEAGVRTGSRVLLVETDLREPGLARRLELDPDLGLGGVLTGRISVDEAIQAVELSFAPAETLSRRLDVLPAGNLLPPNSSELLESHTMDDVLQYLCGIYDLVVLDAPPFTVRADAFALLPKVDGVVAVGRVRHSRRSRVEDLHRTLEISGASQLGVIANGDRSGAGQGKAPQPSAPGQLPPLPPVGDEPPYQRATINR